MSSKKRPEAQDTAGISVLTEKAHGGTYQRGGDSKDEGNLQNRALAIGSAGPGTSSLSLIEWKAGVGGVSREKGE